MFVLRYHRKGGKRRKVKGKGFAWGPFENTIDRRAENFNPLNENLQKTFYLSPFTFNLKLWTKDVYKHSAMVLSPLSLL